MDVADTAEPERSKKWKYRITKNFCEFRGFQSVAKGFFREILRCSSQSWILALLS